MERILDKSMIAGFYVNDDTIVDLTSDALNQMVNSGQHKSALTNDSDVMPGKKLNTDFEFYVVETVSDKEINSRVYRDAAIKQTVIDKGWIYPYEKPIIQNHNLSGGFFGGDVKVLGRAKNAFYLDHASKKITAQSIRDTKLPDAVRTAVAQDLRGGTGSSIIKVALNKSGGKNIVDQVMRTFSQGSIYHKAECNICGQDYISGDCSHYIGRTYTKTVEDEEVRIKCIPSMSDRDPRECSEVQSPANDTSKIYAFNTKSKKLVPIDSLTEDDLFISTGENPSGSNDSNTENQTQDSQIPSDNGENFNEETNDDTNKIEDNKTEKNGGGETTMDKRDLFVKEQVVDSAQDKLKLVFNDAVVDKVLEKLEAINDFETLMAVNGVVKIFSRCTADDFKITAELMTDKTSSQTNLNGEVADNKQENEDLSKLSNDELVKRLQSKDQELADAKSKLANANDDESNQPFSNGDQTDDQTDKEDELSAEDMDKMNLSMTL